MSKFLAVLHLHNEDEGKWLRKLDNVTQRGHHIFSNFTTVSKEGKTYQVMFDGELYNVDEIKQSLRNKGVQYDISNVEQLIVSAYLGTYNDAPFIGCFCIYH